MSNFFIRRPIVAIVISILMVIIGGITIVDTAGRAVSRYRSSRDTPAGALSGRRCRDHGESGSHAHRAADQWRGQHGLHVLAELDQQLEFNAAGRFRSENRSQHGSHPGPITPATGEWPASSPRSTRSAST